MVAELEEKLLGLSINTADSMKQLVKENIYSKLSVSQKLAGAKAKRTAEKWAVGTHWSTHRVVNHKRGLWTDSKGKDHKWNDELVHDFTSHVVKEWDLTFYRQFPQEKISYVDNAKIIITDFANTVIHQDICPDVADGLNNLKERIIKTFNLLRSQTDTAFDDLKKLIKKSHKKAAPAVKRFLEPMYEHCASESGRGLYARNKQFITDTMKDHGVALHREGAKAIKVQLDQLLDNIPVTLTKGHDLVLKQIREDIKSFFDQNSSDGARISTRKAALLTKVRLNEQLMVDINLLAKKWTTKPTVAHELPYDDETEDEIIPSEEFFDLDKGDDADYEDGSDGDGDED